MRRTAERVLVGLLPRFRLMAIFVAMCIGVAAMSALTHGATLVHQWRFDGDTTDSSGSGNDGDTFGDITYTEGISGQALVLDEIDDLVENDSAQQLPISAEDTWSMNVWYNLFDFPSLAYGGGFGGRDDDARVRSFLSFGAGGAEDNAFYFWGSNIDVYAGAEYETDEQWHMYTITWDGTDISMFIDAELVLATDVDKQGEFIADEFLARGEIEPIVSVGGPSNWDQGVDGVVDEFAIWNGALTQEEISGLFASPGGQTFLQAGDADQNLEFNQLDLVQVQIAAKYLTGQPATWGEGDWDGAPGGSVGAPPAGDSQFNQLDIIAALNAGTYLTGPYAAIARGGVEGDGQTSITYDPSNGEVGVDAPAGTNVTSVNIDSASGIFVNHETAQNLDGSFDTHSEDNIFKATFGSSFGSLSFGMVATPGLAEDFVANDLTVIGSLDGGGGLGDVDLVYIPEPSALVLMVIAMFGLFGRVRQLRA